MSRSLYVKKKNLRWAVGDTSVYSNITAYAALITTAPASDDTGYVEPLTANGYARVAVGSDFGSPPVPASDGSLTNTGDITFAAATAPWADVIGWAIFDSATRAAGNLIRYVPLTIAKPITTGDVFSLPAGQAVLREP